MNRNLKILQINISKYFTDKNKNRAITRKENYMHSKINLNKAEQAINKINNSEIFRRNNHYKGIKSIKNLNLNQQISQSPNSKVKISFLNQFNNNSIYYSINKKDKSPLNGRESKLNTEVRSTKNKLIFTEEQIRKTKRVYDLEKTNIIYRTRILEDSKNNESIDGKKDNCISSYRFFPNYNRVRGFNYQNFNNGKKPETTKKKLLKIISKEDLFRADKNVTLINSPNHRNKIVIDINKNKLKKNNNNPERANPEEFIKIKKIGEGSFGKIFKAKWIHNNKNYAMKEMIFQSEDNLLYLQKKLKFIFDFQKKTKCDGLIKIYGYSYLKKKKDYYFYEIMELAERDWEQEINLRKKSYKYYTEKELFSITKQLIKALSLLQKNHITHRDIKLQNILVVNNKYKICDFGESRALSQKGIIVQPVRGSELYMSPVLFYGLNQKLLQVIHNTFKSDVFSLGMCILFAATLGCDCLYEIREMTDMNDIRKVLNKYLSKNYSKNFIEILMCMLEVKEKSRPDFIQMEKVISLYENCKNINL